MAVGVAIPLPAEPGIHRAAAQGNQSEEHSCVSPMGPGLRRESVR